MLPQSRRSASSPAFSAAARRRCSTACSPIRAWRAQRSSSTSSARSALDHLLVATPGGEHGPARAAAACAARSAAISSRRSPICWRKRAARRDPGVRPRAGGDDRARRSGADPAHARHGRRARAAACGLDSVVTLVDGVNGERQLDANAGVGEAGRGRRCACSSARPTSPARRRVARAARAPRADQSRRADCTRSRAARSTPAQLFGARPRRSRGASGARSSAGSNEDAFRREHAHAHARRTRARREPPRRRTSALSACATRRPVTGAGLTAWLNLLAALKGANLLRVKGLVNVEGEPVVVHAVQSVIHEPIALDAWPSADRGTRIVFITRDMERARDRGDAAGARASMRRGARRGSAIDPAAYARFVRRQRRAFRSKRNGAWQREGGDDDEVAGISGDERRKGRSRRSAAAR